MRLKMPDGYRIPAHSHSQPERVTVLAGTLYLGMGDGSDARAAIPLGPGSYSSMPPKMVHFGWMKGETILQLTSIGPWTVTYVNPNDDPRKPLFFKEASPGRPRAVAPWARESAVAGGDGADANQRPIAISSLSLGPGRLMAAGRPSPGFS